MAQIFLDNGEINPALDTPRCKAVSKIMKVEAFNLCLPQCTPEGPPQIGVSYPGSVLGRKNKVVVKMSHHDLVFHDFKKPGSERNRFILTRLALKDSNNPTEWINALPG